MNEDTIKPRNPWLVCLWAYGLFILVHLTEYIWIFLAAQATGSEFGQIAGSEVKNHITLLIRGLVGLFVGLPVTFLVARYLWRRSFGWLRLRFQLHLLGWGLLLGFGLPGLALAILALLRIITVTGTPERLAGTEILAILSGYGTWGIFIATLEEIVFRGMVVRELATRLGWRRGIIYGGLFFGASHLLNVLPVLTPVLVLWVLVGGLISGAAFSTLYRRSDSLWLPIGFHIGGNFLLSALVGTTMSGQDSSFGLWQLQLNGPALLTGGEFGMELSVITLALTGLVILAVERLRRH